MGITGSAGSSITKVQTSDLFARFYAICGSCHVDAANGGHHVDEGTFATTFDQTWYVHIKSDDPSSSCRPRPAATRSRRAPDDPVVELANYLGAWLAQAACRLVHHRHRNRQHHGQQLRASRRIWPPR